MPELIHECGRRVKFPPGSEGKRGKCPHCGGRVEVPGTSRAPTERVHLDPPEHWSEYVAYLEDRGPPPRPLVMPQRLMLQEEADERWERRADVRYSKFRCPSCKERMIVDRVVCTECGLDFRTGHVLGKNAKLNDKGMAYLATVPWLKDLPPPAPEPAERPRGSSKLKSSGKHGAIRRRKRRLR